MGGQAKAKKKSKVKRKDLRSNGGLSPQERMKLKMQEKAKKKTAEKYTVEQLLEKTEECMDSLEFEMAGRFCQRALDVEPDNLFTLDLLGHIHSERGDITKATEISFRESLSPDEGYSKYMSLGQMNTGREAIQYYTKGIQILLRTLEKNPSTTVTTDVCVAYCSVAEIYFTDLCMEDGAGDQCREAIEKALSYHPDNPEALQLMASYLFSTEKNQEGREYLMRSVSAWLPALSDAPPSKQDMEDQQTENDIPPYESRITTAKLLIEAEEYEVAVDVLEGLLEEDDEVVQVIRFFINVYLSLQLYGKLCCDDGPMLEHVEQLLGDLGGETEVEEGEADPAVDEDFVPSSDEEEDAMEH
uniref:Uncharacterized protein n=1 Tax=Esox lucius TaxID=8010 RepID=A0A3P8ZPD3_ESOLU